MVKEMLPTLTDEQKQALFGDDDAGPQERTAVMQELVALGLVRGDDPRSLTRLGVDVRAELHQRGF